MNEVLSRKLYTLGAMTIEGINGGAFLTCVEKVAGRRTYKFTPPNPVKVNIIHAEVKHGP